MGDINVSESDRREFLRIRRKVDTIRGPGVSNSPDAITITQVSPSPPAKAAAALPFKWPPGLPRQCFQYDDDGNVVCDWVMTP